MPPERASELFLSQKQDDGRYHPVAYASQTMNKTEQWYHSKHTGVSCTEMGCHRAVS